MYILGINCCFSRSEHDFIPDLPEYYFHDASAVLIRDGEVVAAVEEERLIRIKHTNRFPGNAINACLDAAGIGMSEVAKIAFFFNEEWVDDVLFRLYSENTGVPVKWTRELIRERIGEMCGHQVDEDRIFFVQHHLSHAYSAYPQSGFDDALVSVMDGQGEDVSLSLYSASGDDLEVIDAKEISRSLGHLYTLGTEILGYRLFDEYKVMGLAPYGDPRTYLPVFSKLYELHPGGHFDLDYPALRNEVFRFGLPPRRKRDPLDQRHKDFAATLQHVTEEIATHVIDHWRRATGHTRLAIAGGVGQNCTLNGKLLADGGFEDVFVHPASHDAGAALGAAMKLHYSEAARPVRSKVRNVYWGSDLPGERTISAMLDRWQGWLSYERSSEVAEVAADLLAEGKVLGWVQGRSEFGPRALGNRSILADPRPEDNHRRVNLMVKNRESYRPFAPSVQAESLRDYFEFPEQVATPDFMVFTVPVRPEKRAELAAITHVDGTARVHAVDREVNERFWRLLEAFEGNTGVPVLLNTSFNNHAEPIVDSVADAIRCFLTTGIDHLVLGDFIVSKLEWRAPDTAGLVPSFPVATELVRRVGSDGVDHCAVTANYRIAPSVSVTDETFELLRSVDGRSTLAELGVDVTSSDGTACVEEVLALWRERLLDLVPPDQARPTQREKP